MGQWQSQPVCTTPACIHAASIVLKNLAPNYEQMDPCTDFDKMVCYGTFEHHGEDGGTMDDVDKRNRRILRKILESPNHEAAAGVKSTMLAARSNTEEFNFDMLRTQYLACMDNFSRTEAGVSRLTDIIVSINSTWTVSPADLETTVSPDDFDDLHRATLLVEEMGVNVFHSTCSGGPVMRDHLNSKLNRICYSGPWLFDDDYATYMDPEAMEEYTETMATVFKLTFPDIDDGTAAALATAVGAFETDVAAAMVPFIEAQKLAGLDGYGTIKNATLAELGESAPALAFDKLIAALTPAGKTPAVILLDEPDYWPELSDIITNHSKAALQGFIIWQTVTRLAEFTDDPELHDLLSIRFNPAFEDWDMCIQHTGTTLRHVLDSYYVKATYPDLTMQAADKMTTNIRKAFTNRISELDWMSPESKKRAIKKAENIVQNVGYPTENPDLRSAESVAEYYTGINITDDHFSNMVAGLRLQTVKGYAEAANPPNLKRMDDITMVNAFYMPSGNFITIPAGISQLPIFHHHLPLYALYGGLGAVIGHEITHGFDNSGRVWSEDAEREVWWDNSTIENFEDRAQCFVDQYSNFEVEVPSGTANVDGEATLGENLSDAGGLRATYNAWAEERKNMPDVWDQSLPGLEGFTHEQLFFLFYGNMWCDATSKEMMVNRVGPGNVHSPPEVRIKGAAENSKAFREAFKCKVKEPACELF